MKSKCGLLLCEPFRFPHLPAHNRQRRFRCGGTELAIQPGETMQNITQTAAAFFEACETGKGWGACQQFCTPAATFSAQAEALAGISTLAQYTDWMKGLVQILPDARYELRSFATDEARDNVIAYGVFIGTHTGPGGPIPPTGKKVTADYVYVMHFMGDKIGHLTKIWNSTISLQQLGWA